LLVWVLVQQQVLVAQLIYLLDLVPVEMAVV
jgi:hypothetical protein